MKPEQESKDQSLFNFILMILCIKPLTQKKNKRANCKLKFVLILFEAWTI
jgi:hypothetical protein